MRRRGRDEYLDNRGFSRSKATRLDAKSFLTVGLSSSQNTHDREVGFTICGCYIFTAIQLAKDLLSP